MRKFKVTKTCIVEAETPQDAIDTADNQNQWEDLTVEEII